MINNLSSICHLNRELLTAESSAGTLASSLSLLWRHSQLPTFGLKPITYQCALQLRDIMHTFYVRKRRILVHFYFAFMFLLEFAKTSSMVKQYLNESFQISYTFLRGSKYRTSNDLVYPQLSPKISTLAPLVQKIKSFPLGCV